MTKFTILFEKQFRFILLPQALKLSCLLIGIVDYQRK
jgi:hypothetical protein